LTHRSDDCFIASNQIVKDLRTHPAIRRRPDDYAASKAASAQAYSRSHAVPPEPELLGTKRTALETAEGGTEPACLQSLVAISQSNKPHPLWQEAFENFVSIAQPPHFVRFVTTTDPA
jgi:hypothetical protein